MRFKRLVAIVAATACAATVGTVSLSAQADNTPPTYQSYELNGPYGSSATGITVAGLLNILPTTAVLCTNQTHNIHGRTLLTLPLGIGTVIVDGTECKAGYLSFANATIAEVDLFNHSIVIRALVSSCHAADGVATVGSTLGSLVQRNNVSRQGSGALIIPGIATVAIDVNIHIGLVASTTGVLITLLPGALHGLPALTVAIANCQIVGHPVSNDG
jgi:hypothetical protein